MMFRDESISKAPANAPRVGSESGFAFVMGSRGRGGGRRTGCFFAVFARRQIRLQGVQLLHARGLFGCEAPCGEVKPAEALPSTVVDRSFEVG